MKLSKRELRYYHEELRKCDDPLGRWDPVVINERYARLIERYLALCSRVDELEWLEVETVRASLAGDEEVGG